MRIQSFNESDIAEVAGLFRETVRHINSNDYNPDQIETWASAVNDEEKFKERLLTSTTLVARIDDKIVGFINLLDNGHLDSLYVHKDFQRQGIASALLHAIEIMAKQSSHNLISTDASITALQFFKQMGFVLVKEQDVNFNGETYRNFMMEKNLQGEDG